MFSVAGGMARRTIPKDTREIVTRDGEDPKPKPSLGQKGGGFPSPMVEETPAASEEETN